MSGIESTYAARAAAFVKRQEELARLAALARLQASIDTSAGQFRYLSQHAGPTGASLLLVSASAKCAPCIAPSPLPPPVCSSARDLALLLRFENPTLPPNQGQFAQSILVSPSPFIFSRVGLPCAQHVTFCSRQILRVLRGAGWLVMSHPGRFLLDNFLLFLSRNGDLQPPSSVTLELPRLHFHRWLLFNCLKREY